MEDLNNVLASLIEWSCIEPYFQPLEKTYSFLLHMKFYILDLYAFQKIGLYRFNTIKIEIID